MAAATNRSEERMFGSPLSTRGSNPPLSCCHEPEVLFDMVMMQTAGSSGVLLNTIDYFEMSFSTVHRTEVHMVFIRWWRSFITTKNNYIRVVPVLATCLCDDEKIYSKVSCPICCKVRTQVLWKSAHHQEELTYTYPSCDVGPLQSGFGVVAEVQTVLREVDVHLALL